MQQIPPTPPPRTGRPWWFWMLTGCGGCLGVVILVSIVGGIFAARTIGDAMKQVGPVDAASVKKQLGPDVPLYPAAQLDTNATRVAMAAVAVGRKIAQGAKDLNVDIAVLQTADDEEKIFPYYRKHFAARKWKELKQRERVNQASVQFSQGKTSVFIAVKWNTPTNQLIILKAEGDNQQFEEAVRGVQ